jgi:hypothetical protein
MKQTINFHQFVDSFSEERKNTFSYHGKKALFEYLEQYEEDTGEEIELDTVALCCEYSEYSSATEAMEAYQPDNMPTPDMDALGSVDLVQVAAEVEKMALEWLQERTVVIEFDNGTVDGRGIIIQDF